MNPTIYSEYLTTRQLCVIRDALSVLEEACERELAEERASDSPDQAWIDRHENTARTCIGLDRLLRDPENGDGFVIVESTRP